ncbi:hypothetical protein PDE_08285 [Penicillium oxalicum 114-2]|uniref:Uncharacterized protein n=1 Tax=Penicillium oxalicum (strain 114-2 / CGMCC 5302) TaxID=933388 RepID=S8B3B9_PENO1|nr:hypothetical protein PDE_08285 [Penicillium oxalicum 114-2]
MAIYTQDSKMPDSWSIPLDKQSSTFDRGVEPSTPLLDRLPKKAGGESLIFHMPVDI